jgi:hypothetical protein
MSDAIYQRGRHVIPIQTFTDRLAAVTVLLLDLGQVCSLRFALPKAVLRPVELLFKVKSSVSCADEFSIRNHAIALLKGPACTCLSTGGTLAIENVWLQRDQHEIKSPQAHVEFRADEGLASIRCRSGLCLCASMQHPASVPLRIHRSLHLFPSLAE